MYEEGESMSAIKAVPSLGIDPTTGQELFMKKDGTITYTWDATDKVICGDSEPKVFGNVGTNLYWKGWNLNMVFKYDLGADYYNSTLAERVEGANPRYNADRRVLNNRWKEPGQHALYKNIKEYTTTYISSRFVQKENTLQLTSLSLSYDLNREWIRKFGLNGTCQDYSKALYWLSEAARQDDSDAYCYIGQCYEYGWGVEIDYHTAIEYYKKENATEVLADFMKMD